MAFFKKVKQRINGKWYPRAVTVGKPVTTNQVADRLAQISTVSRADTFAVLKDLAVVLADYMAQGRTVKLEGVGTFYYTTTAAGKGVDTPEEVSAKQITGVRVRFIPESTRTIGNKVVSRTLVSNEVFWEEWRGETPQQGGAPNNPEGGGSGSGGSENPLG